MNWVGKSVSILGAVTLAWSANAEPVNQARLQAASDEPANWLTFGRDYTNQRFSKLEQINRENVGALALAWEHRTGKHGPFQTQPLVADGMMVITTPGNHVTALDAATGEVLWHYEHIKRVEKTRAGPSNRGPAIGHGKVFQATNDGRLIALDRETGALVWDKLIATPAPGEVEALAHLGPEVRQAFIDGVGSFPAKMPPLVAAGKVIAGVTSAGYGLFQDLAQEMGFGGPPEVETKIGRRGYLVALDVETGDEAWRWHTTKPDGWEGDFTASTPDGAALLDRDLDAEKAAAPKHAEAWRRGGGSTWSTPAYDPELGLIFLGTGNPSPADADQFRPGDNLYTSSLVALEIETGNLRWYYQVVPHDLWGYDVASPPVLFGIPRGYDATPAVGVAAKTGWFYALHRETGELLYRSQAVVPQSNMFRRGTADGITYAPGSFGGASWSPSAFHPGTGFIYVPAIHKPAKLFENTITVEETGASHTFIETGYEENGESWGTLTALDTRRKGEIAWQVKTDRPLVGGVLATATGLVFTGDGDGYFSALDAETGEYLWQVETGIGLNAPPVTYEVNGRQYIAIAAGGSRIYGFAPGDSLFAFALPAEE
jgi:alcohol dehydrogenase (cytochrome c)